MPTETNVTVYSIEFTCEQSLHLPAICGLRDVPWFIPHFGPTRVTNYHPSFGKRTPVPIYARSTVHLVTGRIEALNFVAALTRFNRRVWFVHINSSLCYASCWCTDQGSIEFFAPIPLLSSCTRKEIILHFWTRVAVIFVWILTADEKAIYRTTRGMME